jgi:L-ascorbate metabolism protein UlaG (beta-lactamase superfamily)
MNNSHDTHYADHVDPAVKFVLRGWDPAGGMARHHMKHRDLRVYNLPTNILTNSLGSTGSTNGNSVFVFEAAGICAAHLGHLHHMLSKQQVQRIGRIDVLFVPIDGTVTLSHEEAFNIIGQINPKIIMPMHFSFGGPTEFIEIARTKFPVKRHKGDFIDIGRADLPTKTEVLFLGIEF